LAGARGRNRGLHPSPVRARNRSRRKAHPRSHSRNTSRSLAYSCRLRWFIGLQRSRLLHCLCLSCDLSPDCRWHSAILRRRNHLLEDGDPAAGTARRRMVERSRWTQASYAPCNNRGAIRGVAPILVVEPSLGAARPAWAAWLRIADSVRCTAVALGYNLCYG